MGGFLWKAINIHAKQPNALFIKLLYQPYAANAIARMEHFNFFEMLQGISLFFCIIIQILYNCQSGNRMLKENLL